MNNQEQKKEDLRKVVLIGSYALSHYGIVKDQSVRDIDIICDLETAQYLTWMSPRKTDRILEFTGIKPIDISLISDNVTYELLWTLLSNRDISSEEVIYLKLSESCEIVCLIPPLEWLYAMIRGQIHRIPKTLPNNYYKNIEIWQKQMKYYHSIRSNLGYQKLDQMMVTNASMRIIFETQFEYYNEVLGDAPSMDKEENDFFKDNVTRYIEHDKLHEEVAMIHRNTKELLFRRYQSNPNSVEMDQELFLKAPRQDQINTIREEVIVLLLERKIIPSVVEHNLLYEDGLDNDMEFEEILAHFITNLCGNGHSWLRQWCLDHYMLINDYSSYPKDEMRKYALTFSRSGKVMDLNLHQRILNISDFLDHRDLVVSKGTLYSRFQNRFKEYKNRNKNQSISETVYIPKLKKNLVIYDYNRSNIIINTYSLGEKFFHIAEERKFIIDKNQLLKSLMVMEIHKFRMIPPFIKDKIINYIQKDYQNIIDTLVKNEYNSIISDYDEDESMYIIYDFMSNIGLRITYCEKNDELPDFQLFFLEYSSYEQDYSYSSKFKIGVHFLDILDEYSSNYSSGFDIQTRSTTYYHSTCYGREKRQGTARYLNHFGNHGEYNFFLEKLARVFFEFDEDEDNNTEDESYEGYY